MGVFSINSQLFAVLRPSMSGANYCGVSISISGDGKTVVAGCSITQEAVVFARTQVGWTEVQKLKVCSLVEDGLIFTFLSLSPSVVSCL
jgi:hypothetical protein